jgi:hypothetical protein
VKASEKAHDDEKGDRNGKDVLMTPNPMPTKLGPGRSTVTEALLSVVRDPVGRLIRDWNWKSAVLSTALHAPIFFLINLSAGRKAAFGVLLTELVLRPLTSGIYGSLTEALRDAEPTWLAGLTASVLMPFANHSLELLVHGLRGTPKLAHSILASVCFTVFSTLFNLYAMRRGALIVGENQQSLAQDMRRMPRLIGGFLAAGPLTIFRLLKRRGTRAIPRRPEPGLEVFNKEDWSDAWTINTRSAGHRRNEALS